MRATDLFKQYRKSINPPYNRRDTLIILVTIFVLFSIPLTVVLVGQGLRLKSKAAVPPGTRVPWQGGDWYLHGFNMPWYNWGCDFGCGTGSGVSSTSVNNDIDSRFVQAKDSGMHVARWWVFPGDPWQITKDASGAPTGLNSAIYQDFDSALELAEKHDMYYVFTLFSAPSHIPSSWINNSTQRAQLASVLGQLFSRYRNNPRVLTWQIFNEPEWDMWNNTVDRAGTQALVREVAASVHANSNAYVSVGSAHLDGLPFWVGQGLDYYTAHWYDYMSSGNWCARCTDYNTVKARYNLDAPLVIGEFYAGSDANPLQRFTDWYNKGYAGGFAWSLFYDHTGDRLQIDLAAAKTFAQGKSDIGPRTAAPPGDAELPQLTITSPTNGTTVSGTVNISTTATDNVGVTRVEFYLDNSGAALCTDTTAPYTCSWDSRSVTNGNHTVATKAYDAANNQASQTVSVNVNNPIPDTEKPSVSIQSPPQNQTVSNTVSVIATASDNIGVTKVEFYVDGALKSTDTSLDPYSFSWDTKSVSNGSHTLQAKAHDAVPNIGESTIITVFVSNDVGTPTPPSVDIKANGSNGPVTIIYNTSATLSWSSSGASSCAASGGWSGSKAANGSAVISRIKSNKTFSLTCSGSGGSDSDSVAVRVGRKGDINIDGKVNIFDLSILLSKWATTDSASNLNDEEKVDIFDLSILLSNWG
ncbi:MAG: Ig-like domain-containing protein [Candidatus Woykebacteria bacterium]